MLHGFNLDVVSHCEKAIELEPTLLEGYGCLSTLLMVQEPAASHSANCAGTQVRREYLAATQVLESVTADGGGEVDDVIKLAYAYQVDAFTLMECLLRYGLSLNGYCLNADSMLCCQNSCNWRHFKSIRLRAVALMRERIRQGVQQLCRVRQLSCSTAWQGPGWPHK